MSTPTQRGDTTFSTCMYAVLDAAGRPAKASSAKLSLMWAPKAKLAKSNDIYTKRHIEAPGIKDDVLALAGSETRPRERPATGRPAKNCSPPLCKSFSEGDDTATTIAHRRWSDGRVDNDEGVKIESSAKNVFKSSHVAGRLAHGGSH